MHCNFSLYTKIITPRKRPNPTHVGKHDSHKWTSYTAIPKLHCNFSLYEEVDCVRQLIMHKYRQYRYGAQCRIWLYSVHTTMQCTALPSVYEE